MTMFYVVTVIVGPSLKKARDNLVVLRDLHSRYWVLAFSIGRLGHSWLDLQGVPSRCIAWFSLKLQGPMCQVAMHLGAAL